MKTLQIPLLLFIIICCAMLIAITATVWWLTAILITALATFAIGSVLLIVGVKYRDFINDITDDKSLADVIDEKRAHWNYIDYIPGTHVIYCGSLVNYADKLNKEDRATIKDTNSGRIRIFDTNRKYCMPATTLDKLRQAELATRLDS